jgi:hypothetical protein
MSMQTAIVYLNSLGDLIFEMVKCCVFFKVWAEFLNIILTSFGFRWLITSDKTVSSVQRQNARTVTTTLSSWSRILEKSIVAQIVRKFNALCGTKSFIALFTTTYYRSLS